MELIIVIAIIGVLSAFIFPAFNNDDARRRAVNTYASEFYGSLQYSMTRYQKTEDYISPAIKADDASKQFIEYNPDVGGNVLKYSYMYIEAYYENGLKYVHVADTPAKLTYSDATTAMNAFEKQLQKDMNDIISGAENGYYYAVVYMDNTYNNIKVITAHFMYERLPKYTDSDWKDDNLLFVDDSLLINGSYCGTCSSDIKHGSTLYVGEEGTYMLNITNAVSNVQ